MKTKKIVETLVLAAALTAAQAGAAPISFEGSTITGSYQGATAGMLGLEHWYQDEPGSNTTAFAAADIEFMSGDANFAFDFGGNGQLTVWRNQPVAVSGTYRAVFDFGTSLAGRIGGFTLLDTSAIGVLPVLSILDEHSFALDLSGVSWNDGDGFPTFTLRVDAAAAVPEPGGIGLLLAGAAGLALSRRRKTVARQAKR